MQVAAHRAERGLQVALLLLRHRQPVVRIGLSGLQLDRLLERRHGLSAALQARFGLTAKELDTLLRFATEEARQATDYFQFTGLINKHFSQEQKIEVVENLWQVAFADGRLDAHEQHFMRKIADLLYISHADYVAAKQRAREKG